MRFAIISDIHSGPEWSYKGVRKKLTGNALEYVNEFVGNINNDSKIRFVVQLGDIIDSSHRDSDKKNYYMVIDYLKKLKCPVYHVAGNHDLRHLSEQELRVATGYKELYYSFDMDNIHCIVLFSNTVQKTDIRIEKEQLEWLKKDLQCTDKKTLVFVHHGLSDQDLEGNPWFEGFPDVCLVKNREEVRCIFRDSGKVIAVFMGHLHWNRMDVHDSIPFFTFQSLVENIGRDTILPSKSYAIINLTEKLIEVNIKGNNPEVLYYHYD